jgi:hypothetical protein
MAAAERQGWRNGIYAVIQAMTPRRPQGEPTIPPALSIAPTICYACDQLERIIAILQRSLPSWGANRM